MKKELITAGGRACTVCIGAKPDCILIQPVDDSDQKGLEHELAVLTERAGDNLLFAAFPVNNWFQDLSPWKAPAVFGRDDFGDGAEATLELIRQELLPGLIRRYGLAGDEPVIIGGYSLAALFALWCAYRTDIFAAAAAASPSVWFPGWIDYAERNHPKAGHIYLSLGDKEEKARNRTMAAVGDCIRMQDKLLAEGGIHHTLEWNEGNHFRDSDIRCARGFAWCIEAVDKGKRTKEES